MLEHLTRPNGPPRAMVACALEALRVDRQERQSCAVVVGFILVDFLQRPWTLRCTILSLKKAMAADYFPEPPLSPMTSTALLDPVPASPREVQEVRRLLDEPRSLRWRLAPILGNLFLGTYLLLKGRRLHAMGSLRPQSRRPPLVEVDQPFAPLADQERRAPQALAFVGPPWLERLLEPEGIQPSDGQDPTLIAVAGRAGRDALRQVNGPRAVWLVDGHVDDELRSLLRPEDPLFVADHRLQRALGGSISMLEPAVQPRWQNPYGWWGAEGDRPQWAGEDELPRTWVPVQDLARGITPPGELPDLPPWADPAWEAEADRFVRARQVLRHETLSERLRVVRGSLGLPQPEREISLVSVLLATNRPERAVASLEAVRRQRWPRRELVMVLHGPGFDRVALDRALADLPFPSRVVQANADLTLGHCYELGGRECRGSYVAIMDDDNWFGARYLEDAVLWMETAGAFVGGKFTMPVFFEDDASLHLIMRDHEFRRMQPSSAQAVFRREVLEMVPWRAGGAAADNWYFEDCLRLGVPMCTFDRFNFAYCRGGRRHTYQVSKDDLLHTYRALPLGCPAMPGHCDL